MTTRYYEEKIHYCTRCGASFSRTIKERIQYACNGCNTWPMVHAVVTWQETSPDPDPLEVLLLEEA